MENNIESHQDGEMPHREKGMSSDLLHIDSIKYFF